MTMAASNPAHHPVRASAAVTEIERALTRAAHLGTRTRQHERLTVRAGVPLDRAAVALLREMAETEPSRPGELAQRLGVVAAHVTRQVTRLEGAGYVVRVPDPDDRRARLTAPGRDAVDRLHDAGAQEVRLALAAWQVGDLRCLAVLFHRMVDDFVSREDG